jgi:hypothetical protein
MFEEKIHSDICFNYSVNRRMLLFFIYFPYPPSKDFYDFLFLEMLK